MSQIFSDSMQKIFLLGRTKIFYGRRKGPDFPIHIRLGIFLLGKVPGPILNDPSVVMCGLSSYPLDLKYL